ncbi:MAG: hypothetical protein ACPGKS_00945 [Coraliomargarita sp.]
MPEFEETTTQSDPNHSYAPSTDAKPRTRRRSGGFKKEYGSAPKGNMGEIDPTEALTSEKLSGGAKPADDAKAEAPKKERAPREPKAERPARKERAEPTPEPSASPEPSEATLAAIKRVEERIATRKLERDAKHAERKKAQAAKREAKPEGKKPTPKPKAGSKKAPAKKGLFAAILSIFGLGPKEPEKKPAGNRGGQNRKGGRPQGKGGNRGGQNRQGGNRGRGGKGRGGQNRRRGGGGPRRQTARSEA